MSIDFDKPVQTRDGGQVVIYTTSAKSFRYPVVGEWCNSNGDWMANNWTSRGRWRCEGAEQHDNDLINVPQQHTVWINIYGPQFDGDFVGLVHGSKKAADQCAAGGKNASLRTACFEHTFTRGEGLDAEGERES